MIETTITAHDAAEIEILADALQSIAAYRRRQESEAPQITLPFPPEAVSAMAQTATVTVVDSAPAEAPKRRGRPPKAAKVDEAAAEAAEERAAIQAEATMAVAEPEPDDDIPLPPPLTLETVRAALAEASQAGKTAGVRAALAAVKATRLTEVDPSRYQELLDKVNAL